MGRLKTQETMDLEHMMGTPGWGVFIKMLDEQEARGMGKLRKCAPDKLEHARGFLDGIEYVKRWCGMKLFTAAQAINVIEELGKEYNG